MAENPTEKENYIRELNQDLRYSASKFDGQTLAISGGALGVSLTFIKDIVPFQTSSFLGLFFAAQFFLIASMLLGFVSHYVSLRGTESNIEKANLGDFEGIITDNASANKCIRRCNFSVLMFLTLGVVLLVLYCGVNIVSAKDSFSKRSFVQERRLQPEKLPK